MTIDDTTLSGPEQPAFITSHSAINLLKLQDSFFTSLKVLGRSINTLKNYRTDLACFNNFLLDQRENLDISGFGIEEIKQYGEFLETKYNSDNSRRRRVQALRLFFDFLVSEKVFSHNPVKQIPTSPKFLDIPRPASFTDLQKLWRHLNDESHLPATNTAKLIQQRNKIVIVLVYYAGLKVSDLSNLSRENIFITPDDTPRVMIDHTKRDPYTIPLPSFFGKIHKKYIKLLETFKTQANKEFSQLLFNANPYRILSGGLSPRGAEVIFEDFRIKLDIEITPKSLRQACIFRWLQAEQEESQIKEWMGVSPAYSLELYKNNMPVQSYCNSFFEETSV